jgi:transcriptional regulator with XRE-family HTH domain
VAARSGMERARLSEYLTRRRLLPPAETLEKLSLIAQSFARDELSGDGSGDANGEGNGVLARHLAAREGIRRPCALPGCSELARRWSSVTCSERHRKGMARLAREQSTSDPPLGHPCEAPHSRK